MNSPVMVSGKESLRDFSIPPSHSKIDSYNVWFPFQAKKAREKEEADKWKNVPVWKRKLMEEKEKEKKEKDKEAEQKVV